MGNVCQKLPLCINSLCSKNNIVRNEDNYLQCLCPYGKYGIKCQKELICQDSNIICETNVDYITCPLVYFERCYCCNESKNFFKGILAVNDYADSLKGSCATQNPKGKT